MTGPRRPVRRLRPARDPIPRLADAIDEFLAHPDLANSSRRSYSQTLGRLQQALGVERPVDRLGARELERAAREAWGQTAPATWNRHVATLRSFSGFCLRRNWIDAPIANGLERRREPVDRTKAIPYAQLDRLWRRDDVAVREKALWRLLYETAARAQEVLSLNVEDVDLENKSVDDDLVAALTKRLNALGVVGADRGCAKVGVCEVVHATSSGDASARVRKLRYSDLSNAPPPRAVGLRSGPGAGLT